MSGTTRSSDGTAIAFDLTGNGPPLVVVGGALNTRGSAAGLAAALADRFTVATYDRRGRGDSGDTPPYAVEREIEDLDAVIAEVDRSAFVVGHSSGAALALRAARAGSPIERLAMYEPPFILDDARAPVPPDYVEHLEELVAESRRGDAVAYFLETGTGMPAAAVAGMRGAPFWPSLEALAHTLAYDGRVMGEHISGQPFAGGAWSAISIPTLVMDGGASPAWIRNAARGLAAAIPGAEHRTLPDQRHDVDDGMLAAELARFGAG